MTSQAVQLSCLRCGDETTFNDSYPNGCNQLKRIEKACSSIDRCMNVKCGHQAAFAITDMSNKNNNIETICEHNTNTQNNILLSRASQIVGFRIFNGR